MAWRLRLKLVSLRARVVEPFALMRNTVGSVDIDSPGLRRR